MFLTSFILDEESAVLLTMALWDVIEENGQMFDTRVLIGGMGREQEENADRFALIAMEATRRRHSVMPVLTLRLHKKQNPALMDKALQLISAGCIYPTLYNDDTYVPGCMEIMHVPYEDAVKYAPLGCGEVLLECASTGSPNSTMNMLKALEVTLHNGLDGADGEPIGIPTGEPEEFETYDQLEEAFLRQLRAAFETYFALGGLQLNVNCFSRGDLEKAIEHPEQYSGLIVRVSGYSAKFTTLDPVLQKQIMDRTLF